MLEVGVGFDDVAKASMALSSRDFLARFQEPFLVAECVITGEGLPTDTTKRASPEDWKVTPEAGVPILYVVAKRSSRHPGIVTVGRSESNDLDIPSPLLSKKHAYFSCEQNGTWAVADAGSLNGTFVGGKRLAPHARMRLSDSDRLSFGPITFHFFTPEAFYRFLSFRRRIKRV